MNPSKLDIRVYETATLWTRLFNKAVKEAQSINHKNGLPNVFSRNGKIYYEYPNGQIMMKEKLNEKEEDSDNN